MEERLCFYATLHLRPPSSSSFSCRSMRPRSTLKLGRNDPPCTGTEGVSTETARIRNFRVARRQTLPASRSAAEGAMPSPKGKLRKVGREKVHETIMYVEQ